MDKKEDAICDVTTGICGSANASKGVIEFLDLTSKEEKDDDAEEKN